MLSFVHKTLPLNKQFQAANIKALQLFRNIIKAHPSLSQPYAKSVVEVGIAVASQNLGHFQNSLLGNDFVRAVGEMFGT